MTIPDPENPKNFVAAIRKAMPAGTRIPKPKSDTCVVKGWGRRRGEPALIVTIRGRHEKGIAQSEWVAAGEQLRRTGEFTRPWFNKELVDCEREGGCNFTTIGGVFVQLGIATYRGCGRYMHRANQPSQP